MSEPLSPATATLAVLWGGLVIGLLLGAAGQASRFCVRGAVADWFLFGGKARVATWVLAVAVAALGCQWLVSQQVVDATRSLPWAPRLPWLSCVVGGLLFGYGMVLAGGCPQRSLVKTGAGNLRCVVTLLVAGIAAQMTLRGLFAGWRAQGLDRFAIELPHPQDAGSLLAAWSGQPAGLLRWAVVAVVLVAAAGFLWRQRRVIEPSHWVGGAAVGLLVVAAWFLTGHVGHLAEHPETLEEVWLGTQSRRPEGLSFTGPLAHALDLLTLWSDRNLLASFGVLVALGVLLGSFVSARLRGEFRLESFRTPREFVEHAAGGLLMGFGGVTALGCSIGQGVTGLGMLSVGALLATAAMVGGALLALRRQRRLAESA
ncbi:YeeE/YedE family protein [Piscinibacter sakaiensis]|uniref:Lipocalin-related protein n=1 Tax=Piscinibacter sakaiensis TaxID=1547922 RepID=A0A0K8NU32_PISS1|nr:YeeE/YedE family protein [Piscinibacter sakaiensis]GAP33897.1 lipocalin-related protein [Piscinibacter sakaiensis]